MKRFIVILIAFFCLSIAQDIAGSWNLTAVEVQYRNFARPNHTTMNEAFGDNEEAMAHVAEKVSLINITSWAPRPARQHLLHTSKISIIKVC